MKLLNDAVIRDRYDVVVVGAGLGGLTAAGLLAKRGLRVLVLEQHYIPGGCCTAIRRNDVAMDVGAALLFGWDDKTSAHPFVMNELEEEIDMIPHESTYRMHLGKKKTVTFWRDLDRYLNELTAVFPNQDREIRALYRECRELYDVMMGMAQHPVPPTELPLMDGLKMAVKDPLGMVKMQKLMSMSGEDLLTKYITDPKTADFFDFLIAACTTCTVKETPASMVVAIFMNMHLGGTCYPSGSPQMLPNKLEKAIEKFGGQIVYRKMVDEILIWKGAAYGVRLSDGTEILADSVISNADVWTLYGTLVKPRHIKPERIEWAQKFEPTPATLVLYISVKEEAIPEGTNPIEFYVRNVHDVQGGDNYMVYIPSLEDPSIAPPGTHSITAMGTSQVDWPRPRDRFYRSEEYKKLKEEETERVLNVLQDNYLPNLKKNIISIDVGTASTIEKYTMKYKGNIGGPKFTTEQFFFNRLKARSEWKNLYCVGDSTAMGEGVISVTMSGVGAANMLLKDRGLLTYRGREFSKHYVNMIEGKPWTPTPDPGEPITEESAMRIGRDCQHCQEPECRNACPANIETSMFARRIESGNFNGAARVLREVNPFSEICGYICPAERFCEKECSRLDFSDRPVRIRELHGWVCGHASKFEGWDRAVAAQNGRKVAVVGAGPAGLTCAHYLARLGYQVDIMDKAKAPGGMLSHAVPAFRLRDEIVEREIEGLSLPGMTFQYGKALGKDFSVGDLEAKYHAVFLAPGLWSGRTLNIIGLEKSKMTDGLSFLQSCRGNGKGKVGKDVVVIGGGSVASDSAVTAKRGGAKKVTLVCLEGPEEMPCLQTEIDEMKNHGIKIENGWGPKAAPSKSKLSFARCKSVFDKSGAFRPVFDESEIMELGFDQVILAVGQQTEPALAKYLKKEFGREDRVEVDTKTMQVVGRNRVFAGGDIVRGAGTVVEAVGDGRSAAAAIDALFAE
jgi:phytoene dehydrogenase-like protein